LTLSIFRPPAAELSVYTYKAGALSSRAHDLRLRCTDFEIERDGAEVRAWADLKSLRFSAVMHLGQVKPSRLVALASGEIERNIQAILRSVPSTRATFEGRIDSSQTLVGTLFLGSASTRVSAQVKSMDAGLVVSFSLLQSSLALKPFSALFGTLQVQDRVEVVVRCPNEAQASSH
jgi:hypothetical protein